MTQPPLPKPVFVKRKPSSKRRRRAQIPSPPHSPDKAHDESAIPSETPQQALPPQQSSLQQSSLQRPSPTPRRPRGRVMRAQNLSVTPAKLEQSTVNYSAQSLQRLREAQTSRPPPSSMTERGAAQIARIAETQPVPGTGTTKPPMQPSRTERNTQKPTHSRPAPFTAAWNPMSRPDEVSVEDQPDLSFLPTQEGSNSSDDGWEASQLARGGGRVDEQDYKRIIRHTEETVPTKGHVAKLKAALATARKELEGRELSASETAKRATRAVEDAKELIEDAERSVREREAVVEAYDDVLQVFRRVCECLRKEKETILEYRERLLQRLEREAKEVRVRLSGGEDEFGRSVPGRLTEVDDDFDEDVVMNDDDTENREVGFDAEKMMDEVIDALNKWKTTDKDGYAQGFGAEGGGGVIGRLGLASPNTAWLKKKLDKETRKAALEAGEVAKLIGAEIRAKWEPRRKDGFREWGQVVGLIQEDLREPVRERFGWEVNACVRHADAEEAARCVRGCLEVGRLGVDPGIRVCLEKLRHILGEQFCKDLDEEIAGISAFHADGE